MQFKTKINSYTCIETLLDNQYAGRTTYLAQDKNGKSVILKKFEFGNPRASWSSYKAMEKEVKLLQKLDHPQISHYLDYFQIKYGFVLVTEYINASHLGKFKKRFEVEEVKTIAENILNILSYLQQQHPPIIHRDIKPENILWDGKKAYLIDFGIATAASQTMTLTSTVGGTIGFTSPEILRGRKATLNSDLYSLGATLFCLLKGIESKDITTSTYVSFDSTINWNQCASEINDYGLYWLKQLSHPNPDNRFQTSAIALDKIEAFAKRELLTKRKTINSSSIKRKKAILKINQTAFKPTPKKVKSKLTLYERSLVAFDIANLGATILLGISTVFFLNPILFLGLNILPSGLYLTLFMFILSLYMGVLIWAGYYCVSNYEDLKTSFYGSKRIIIRSINIILRIIEIICFLIISNSDSIYYPNFLG